MKKLFSLVLVFALAAILGVSTVSAQKTIAVVEKLWSRTLDDIGATILDTRQGAGRDGKVYLLNKADQSFVAVSETSVDTIFQGPLEVEEGVWANLDGTAYALDDAGNFVMEGTFPNVPSHLVLRKADGSIVKDLAITGLKRTDFINATGDVFSAEGGYVFVYGNSANLLVYTIANGELVGEPKEIVGLANTSNNYVIAGDANTQIVHRRSSEAGWVVIENGVETLIEGMEGFKKTTLGGDIITLDGKEFYIYPSGTTHYSSEFVVRNMTDSTFAIDKTNGTTLFYSNTLTTSYVATYGCWLNASKIDDNNAYIHVYNADGAAVFKLSMAYAATISLDVNDATMGVIEGAGDVAVGGSATVKATPNLGHSFVCWKNGENIVSSDAEYTFKVEKDIALTAIFQKEANKILTLTTSDLTLGSITLPEDIVLGENSVVYGTTMVLTAVPAKGGAFVGWYNNEGLYSKDYTIEITMLNNVSLTAKFIETLSLAYELNGGVTNDYGWTSKGAIALELQKDYNAAYGTTREWAKLENGYIYYNLNGTWTREDQVPEGTECTITGFLQSSTWNASDNWKNLITNTHANKYAWLHDVIVATRTTAGMDTTEADMNETTYRKELSAFFLCSPVNDIWPKSPSYEVAGTYASFGEIWEHAFANPTEVDVEVVLNAPYKDGYIFDGWYTNANFSGEPITIVSPTSAIAGGKLYAKLRQKGMLNSPRAWAYDLALAQKADAYTFTFKATTAANATLIFTDAEGAELATVDLGAVEAGLNTKTLAASELPQGKKVNWAVKMAGEAIAVGETLAEVTDQSRGIYDFYCMMDVLVDNNPESEYFGRIYIQMAIDGADDAVTDRSAVQTAGFYLYDQALNELNSESNVSLRPTLPEGYTMGDARNKFHRLDIDPKTSNITWCYNIAGQPAVFAVDPANLAGEATNLVAGVEGLTRTAAHCFDADGALYIMDLQNAGTIYKVVDDVATIFVATNSIWINPSITLAADGKGGLWVAQNRGQMDAYYYQLAHYTKDGVLDYAVYQGNENGFTGSSQRGALAYDVERQILAQGRNGAVELFNVAYNAETGVPTLTKFATTPTVGNNIDGLHFDYAGDLYVVTSTKEKFHKFVVPTDNNVCVVPAASKYAFCVNAKCGDYLYWEYHNSELTITGYGDMYDYDIDPRPWEDKRNKMQSVSLPDGMTSVGASAFADCKYIKSVTIPASVEKIDDSAFEDCRMLSTLTFAEPSALTTIGNWAFYNNHELKNLVIPEGVSEIGYAAFYGCTYLDELSLPESMLYIADNGFALCAKLRRMNVSATTPPTVEARTFEDVDRAIPVYVPTEAVSRYKAAPVWEEFNIVGRDNAPTAVENSKVDSSNAQKLLRDGQLLIIRDGKTYNAMGQEI